MSLRPSILASLLYSNQSGLEYSKTKSHKIPRKIPLQRGEKITSLIWAVERTSGLRQRSADVIGTLGNLARDLLTNTAYDSKVGRLEKSTVTGGTNTNQIWISPDSFIILHPMMLFLKPKQLLNFPITDGSLSDPQLACNRDMGTNPPQELRSVLVIRNFIIDRIKDLKPQTILPDREITHLPEITGIDVRPAMRRPFLRILNV